MVSERSNYFFNPNLMDAHKLDSNVVLVKLNGKDIFCDPGAPLHSLRNADVGRDGCKACAWTRMVALGFKLRCLRALPSNFPHCKINTF